MLKNHPLTLEKSLILILLPASGLFSISRLPQQTGFALGETLTWLLMKWLNSPGNTGIVTGSILFEFRRQLREA